jgi:hypothetical protein
MLKLNQDQTKNLLCICLEMSAQIYLLAGGDGEGFETVTNQAKIEASELTHNERLITLGQLLPIMIEHLELMLDMVNKGREIVEKY